MLRGMQGCQRRMHQMVRSIATQIGLVCFLRKHGFFDSEADGVVGIGNEKVERISCGWQENRNAVSCPVISSTRQKKRSL
ncbi:hypothetical protein EV2_011923 [Malus domestica]